MPRAYCYITVREKFIEIESTYNKRFVEELKGMVPHTERTYDPETKVWTCDPKYLPNIKDLAKNCFERSYLIEGYITTNLSTGAIIERGALWGVS